MCGISGIYAKNGELSIETGLMNMGLIQGLTHRGKESCGISCDRGENITTRKGLGSPSEAVSYEWIARNPCRAAIAQVRYSTTGSGVSLLDRYTFSGEETQAGEFKTRNAQPFFFQTLRGMFSLDHNGNLTNGAELKEELLAKQVQFFSETDSEVILKKICYHLQDSNVSVLEAIKRTMRRLVGSYSCLLLCPEGLFAFRDSYGNRPLKIAETLTHYLVASESCAWHKYEADYISSVGEGEIVVFTTRGIERHQTYREPVLAHCIFENIYFKSPNTNLTSPENRQGGNGTVSEFRYKLGKELAIEHPRGSGIIIPLMDSGEHYAYGYQFVHAQQMRDSGGYSFFLNPLPKDKSIGRAFIEPTEKDRNDIIKRKYFNLFDSMRDHLELIYRSGQAVNLICIDDSLVRSNTSNKMINRIRTILSEMFPTWHQEIKISWLLGSPPLKYPCYYGIDFPSKEELIASALTVEETREQIGADYLGYLSLDALKKVIGSEEKHFCQACFTSIYPIPIGMNQGKMALAK